jgi:hypothetical protein
MIIRGRWSREYGYIGYCGDVDIILGIYVNRYIALIGKLLAGTPLPAGTSMTLAGL